MENAKEKQPSMHNQFYFVVKGKGHRERRRGGWSRGRMRKGKRGWKRGRTEEEEEEEEEGFPREAVVVVGVRDGASAAMIHICLVVSAASPITSGAAFVSRGKSDGHVGLAIGCGCKQQASNKPTRTPFSRQERLHHPIPGWRSVAALPNHYWLDRHGYLAMKLPSLVRGAPRGLGTAPFTTGPA
ncbi:hypothetical protein N431DRAFT_527922 [Stipitochalara longipes BDJ]|nr:hypothetical protein N431DRAFT_527922 [Stipitochalara longipes BDJ]